MQRNCRTVSRFHCVALEACSQTIVKLVPTCLEWVDKVLQSILTKVWTIGSPNPCFTFSLAQLQDGWLSGSELR